MLQVTGGLLAGCGCVSWVAECRLAVASAGPHTDPQAYAVGDLMLLSRTPPWSMAGAGVLIVVLSLPLQREGPDSICHD